MINKILVYNCNECLREVKNLNDLEIEEIIKEVAFVCSDCINREMKGGLKE